MADFAPRCIRPGQVDRRTGFSERPTVHRVARATLRPFGSSTKCRIGEAEPDGVGVDSSHAFTPGSRASG
jgi:hypothetical protein